MRRIVLFITTVSITALFFGTMVLAVETAGLEHNSFSVSYNKEGKEKPATQVDKKCRKYHKKYLGMAASLLGIKESELNEKLQNGDNLHGLLNEAGKIDEYKELLLSAKKEKLAKLVIKGKITEEEAKAKYAEFEERVTNWDGTPENELFKR